VKPKPRNRRQLASEAKSSNEADTVADVVPYGQG
jgi:hypothetical protein